LVLKITICFQCCVRKKRNLIKLILIGFSCDFTDLSVCTRLIFMAENQFLHACSYFLRSVSRRRWRKGSKIADFKHLTPITAHGLAAATLCYIFACDNVHMFSFIFAHRAPEKAWWVKVIQGHRNWYPSKAHIRFPISS